MAKRWTKWFKDGEPVELPDGEYMADDRTVIKAVGGKITWTVETRYRAVEESDG
jgi:hypothetical protein